MNKKLNVFKQDYLSWSKPRNWLSNIKQFFINFKWAYQRAVKGYCDKDLWDMHEYLLMLLSSELEQLANTENQWPDGLRKLSFNEWQSRLLAAAQHFKNANIHDNTVELNKPIIEAKELAELYQAKSIIGSTDFERILDYYDTEDFKADAINNEEQIYIDRLAQCINEKDLAFSILTEIFFELWD